MYTNQTIEVRAKFEDKVFSALETYSNIHRGSGHNAEVTERLYKEAGETVLNYLELDHRKYTVIFCSPRRADMLCNQMVPGSYRVLSSADVGLPVGLRAVAAKKRSLPVVLPFLNGGGTARLLAADWVVRAGVPGRYEAGTPAIISVIAFAEAIRVKQTEGKDADYPNPDQAHSSENVLSADEFNGLSGRELLNRLRESVVGHNHLVGNAEGAKPYVHLDNAASTRTFAPVWEAVRKTWQLGPEGKKQVVREADRVISEFLGAPLSEYNILYSSNTTEAINLVAENLVHDATPGTVVLNTLLEHNSNDLPWRYAGNLDLVRVGIDRDGFVNLKVLEQTLREYNEERLHGDNRIRLVAVSGASNVLGIFNDMKTISALVHRYGARLLVDAAQLVAHRTIDMAGWGIDYLAFSAHKVYAPFGTGVLICRKALLNFSDTEMELIRSSGEENAGGIAGLVKSLILLRRVGMDLIQEEESALTGYALRSMAEIPEVKIFGIKDPDSPAFRNRGGVISFGVGRKISTSVAASLAAGGFGVRSGCHCAHMLVKFILDVPRSLENFQRVLVVLFPKLNLPGVVRISFGIENTQADIDRLMVEMGKIAGSRN
jgi:selenocysteine lyase/cysteine desulfurase